MSLNKRGDAKGDGATRLIAAATATEEVAQSASVLRDLFRLFPSLQLAFWCSFFLLTIFLLAEK